MVEVDRVNGPVSESPDHVEMIKAEATKLDNGWDCFVVNAGTQDLVRIECNFAAGLWHQKKSLVAAMTNQMFNEGTNQRNAYSLAESFDYYGAFLQTDVDEDMATIELYTLNKHIPKVLPLMKEVFFDSIFPKNEFDIHVNNRRQKYQVDSGKVAYRARQEFPGIIFGKQYPYGMRASAASFENIAIDDCHGFYQSQYQPRDAHFILSGKVDNTVLDLMNKEFGQMPMANGAELDDIAASIQPHAENKHFFEQKGAIQSAIRIGRPLFNKLHPDFMGMQVLNTLLGGYFSSRLMSNIREDKGYTYGIGSGLVSLMNNGYFFIATEVGAEVREAAVSEIYLELRRLREELVPQHELDLVKNYMLGSFMRNTDGPFALADRFSALHRYGLDYSFYDALLQKIKTITSADIQSLAQRYLQEKDLYEVVVGK